MDIKEFRKYRDNVMAYYGITRDDFYYNDSDTGKRDLAIYFSQVLHEDIKDISAMINISETDTARLAEGDLCDAVIKIVENGKEIRKEEDNKIWLTTYINTFSFLSIAEKMQYYPFLYQCLKWGEKK